MIGIVLVSHSPALAKAALDLARQMVPTGGPRVAVAAGAGEGIIGTDATRVADAITEAASPDGVLVLMDLGSAVLSAEFALELDPPTCPVRLVAAPFVEGLLAALVRAAGGATLEEVAAEALSALAPKQSQLPGDEPVGEPVDDSVGDSADAEGESVAVDGGGGGSADGIGVTQSDAAAAGGDADATERAAALSGTALNGTGGGLAVPGTLRATVTLINADGLHARPAAALAAALGGLDAKLAIRSVRTDRTISDAASMVFLMTLDARAGDALELSASGVDAALALQKVCDLIESGFGEPLASDRSEASAAHSQTGTTASSASKALAGSFRTKAERTSATPTRPAAAEPAPAVDRSVPAVPGAPAPAAPVAPLGVSPGLALAPTRHLAVVVEPDAAEVADRDAEASRIGPAFAAVQAMLTARADRNAQADETVQILQASAALAGDPGLISVTETRVRETGVSAARAVWEELNAQADLFASLGGRQAERAADLRELRGRLVAYLTGQAEPGLPDVSEPFVLVAPELGPADAALLGGTGCVGLVLAQGGATSHAAIIARSLGLPAVVWAQAPSLPENAPVFIDGTKGVVELNPGPGRQSAVSAAARSAVFDGYGHTADGTAVALRANLVASREVATARAAHAQGVGLLRTEVLFIGRADEPSVAEQAAQYREVLRAFGSDPVVIRTLDAGSDKPLAFVPEAAEPNPALGVRGFRTAWGSPGILDRQLQALAQALREARAERALAPASPAPGFPANESATPPSPASGSATGGSVVTDSVTLLSAANDRVLASGRLEPQLWVMAPMIATAEEARDFVARAQRAGLGTAELPAKLGVMVETPSAALTADAILAEVDFVSIGTNDLTQYTMAADRELGALAQLGSAWQPAVLRLIGLVGEAGARVGKHVGVCGEAGGDPVLAPVLVGLGVTSLSMAPRSLGFVAESVAGVTLEQCRAAAQAALAASSLDEARLAAVAELTHS